MSETQEPVSRRSGKSVTSWTGWEEIWIPETPTLEGWRRLQAEGDAEGRPVPRSTQRAKF